MGMLDRAAEQVGWKSRKLDGVLMTALNFLVLSDLAAAKAQGCPFVALDIYPTSLRSMIQKDWIVESAGIDGTTKYCITYRGEKALKRFTPIYRRNDKLCPRCEQRKRRVRRNGTLAPYCAECENRISRRKHDLGIIDRKPGLCKCGKRNKVVTPSGYVKSYCKVCERRSRKRYKKSRDKRLRKRIEAGEKVMCSCGKGELYVQPSGRVSDRCPDCLKKYMDAYNHRRRSA